MAPNAPPDHRKRKDEAFGIIRDMAKVLRMDDPLFTQWFGIRNSSRTRVLDHIKGGSLDIEKLKVTTHLRDARTADRAMKNPQRRSTIMKFVIP